MKHMPRYYFDTAENQNEVRDEVGMVLPNEKSARDEAIRALPGLAMDVLPDGAQHSFWVRVRNEEGAYIFEACLDLKSHWLSAESPRDAEKHVGTSPP